MKDQKLQLPESDMIVIDQLAGLFREVGTRAEIFKEMTGVRCPDMCGRCCEKEVETTALEMLPLAAELWSKNEADMWLDKIHGSEKAGLCVFFRPDTHIPGNGRCGIYSLRPLICRLFGFFTVKDKYGKYVYGSCKVIKEQYPASFRAAKRLIEEGYHPSSMTDFTIKIIGMGSDIGRKMVPINTACKIALEKVGFTLTKMQEGGS